MRKTYLLIIATLIITGLSVYWGDTLIGMLSSITGVICVILTAKGTRSCYIFGLINTILYIYISYTQIFYGEVMLNGLYYLPMQVIGWFAMYLSVINVIWNNGLYELL